MRKNILLTCCLSLSVVVSAQNDFLISPSVLQTVIPASPNAASLGKFGAVPVSAYTGVPDISIPIYEINTGGLKLPISISYHAGGIKVEEIASSVGLGWSLNAGGSMTRQVRGKPDENDFYQYANIRRFLNNQMSSTEAQNFKTDIFEGNIDSQPDIYYYNTPVESGSFFFDTTGQVLTIPLSKNIVTLGSLTDTKGNIYNFDYTERTTTTPTVNGSLAGASGYYGQSTTAWYMSSMRSPGSSDEITFQYDSSYYSFTTTSAQTKYYLLTATGCSAKDPTTVSSTNTINGLRLKKILFPNGQVNFNKQSTERLDLPGDYALDNIEIINSDSSLYKKVKFFYSYQISNGAPSTYNSSTSPPYYRLFLDSLKVVDANNTVAERYDFSYNSGLPERTSYSQDHFGYNNGVSQTVFTPKTTLTAGGSTFIVSGADRVTRTTSAMAGILTSIKYPTGGSTHFSYESNNFLSIYPYDNVTTANTGYMIIGSIANQNYYTDSFTLDYAAVINCTLSTSSCGGGQANLECPQVSLYGPNGYIAPITTSFSSEFPAGNYTVTADLSGVTDPNIFNAFSLTIQYPKSPAITVGGTKYYEVTAGGLRIHEIYSTDNSGNITNKKSYEYNLPDTSFSSGSILAFPRYVAGMTNNPQGSVYCQYVTINSSSNYPLLSTKGSFVGYSFVREFEGENGSNGVTEYTYVSPGNVPDIVPSDHPFAPSTSYEWKRGLLLKQVIKKKQDGMYATIQEKSSVYTDKKNYSVTGLKVGKAFFSSAIPEVYETASYSTATGWTALTSDTTKIYDANNGVVTTIKSYNYSDNAMLPSQVTSLNSRGETMIMRMKYPPDYAAYSGSENKAKGIEYLKGGNIVGIPVEQRVIGQAGAGSSTYKNISGVFTSFKSNRAVPDTIWDLKRIGSTDTAMSFVSSGGLNMNADYKARIAFLKYDSSLNLSEQKIINNVSKSYIWDYKNTYPVAECVNADSTSIAFTSFEADSKGRWTYSGSVSSTYSMTGAKSYNCSGGNLTKSNLTSATYIVSYWGRSGSVNVNSSGPTRTGKTVGSWTYYEHEVTGTSITVSGSNYIDELRLYPKGALMVSCTYKPLIGLSSQSDASGRIVYYEYDSFGRLKLIRDEDGKIVKSMDYKYQGTYQD